MIDSVASYTNVGCCKQVLEFLPQLIDTLKDEGYSLTEPEAFIFLPCLMEKVCLAST